MLLITGATGNVGRPLVAGLVTAGAKVRALTRNPVTADLPEGVDVFGGDLADPESVAEAFDGVTGLFLNPAAVGRAVPSLLALAAKADVKRITVLSSAAIRDGEAQQTDPLAYWHKQIEDGVSDSGLGWTFLRPDEFAVNTLQQWAPQIRFTGTVREAYGAATTAVIDERDVAAVAATVMLDDSSTGQCHYLTGPRSLTRRAMVSIVADKIGLPVAFEEVPPEAALEAMVGFGLDRPIAESVLALRQQSVGRDAVVSPGVGELTGRPATPFEDWTADHSAAFG